MSELKQLQRRMASAVMMPLTSADHIQPTNADGRSMRAEAKQFVKPNDRLTSLERLEIYNRQYWFRILDAFADDFPGLRAIIGQRRFDRLSQAYLAECPSRSFTLRNLGSRLLAWLREHPEWIEPRKQLALDMVRLEWAQIECFDAADEPILGPEDLLEVTPTIRFGIQPHIRLLQLSYPVDELLLAVKRDSNQPNDAASNAGSYRRKQHPAVRKVQRLNPERIYVALHRHEYMVCYRRLTPEAFRLLRSLRQGIPMGAALDYAVRGSRMRDAEIMSHMQEWFRLFAQLGWFSKAAAKPAGARIENPVQRGGRRI